MQLTYIYPNSTKRHQQLTHYEVHAAKGNKLNHNGYCHARYTLEIARQFKLHAKSKLMPLSLNKLRTYKHKALPNDHTKHHIPFLFPKAWHHSASLAAADVVPDFSWTSGRSEQGRTSCSRVPRRWSACPRRRIPFFKGTAAPPTPAWSVPSCWRAWLARLRAPGQRLDPVAVVINQPSM